MDQQVRANAILQKMAVKLANAELRASMMEVALEAAQEENARLKSETT